MASSIACRRVLLALVIALPLIQAQRATDPTAQYNVTVSPWVNHRYVVGVSYSRASPLLAYLQRLFR